MVEKEGSSKGHSTHRIQLAIIGLIASDLAKNRPSFERQIKTRSFGVQSFRAQN
jgi:hypothetical protein